MSYLLYFSLNTSQLLGYQYHEISFLEAQLSHQYNLNYQLIIPKDGVASFNSQGHEWALTHFKDTLGATVE